MMPKLRAKRFAILPDETSTLKFADGRNPAVLACANELPILAAAQAF